MAKKIKKKYSNIFTAKVNDYNRITIPKHLAEKFGIERGDLVTIAILEVNKVGMIEVTIFPADIDKKAADYEEIANYIGGEK